MSGSVAALFLWQTVGFSCRDAHAFNRRSSAQMTAMLSPSEFPFVTERFTAPLSPVLPSFQQPPLLVVLAFIEAI